MHRKKLDNVCSFVVLNWEILKGFKMLLLEEVQSKQQLHNDTASSPVYCILFCMIFFVECYIARIQIVLENFNFKLWKLKQALEQYAEVSVRIFWISR